MLTDLTFSNAISLSYTEYGASNEKAFTARVKRYLTFIFVIFSFISLIKASCSAVRSRVMAFPLSVKLRNESAELNVPFEPSTGSELSSTINVTISSGAYSSDSVSSSESSCSDNSAPKFLFWLAIVMFSICCIV